MNFLDVIFNFLCSVQSGQFSEDMIPTVGFNMRKVTKGNVTIKVGSSAERDRSSAGNELIWTSCCALSPSPSADMGHRRTAPLQEHVGALLQRGQCNRVGLSSFFGLLGCIERAGSHFMCLLRADTWWTQPTGKK